MNIGQAAKATHVSAKMIRYYESVGLIPKALRSEAGYRHYSDADLGALRFIRSARDLGFPLEKISELLKLWRNEQRPSAQVKALAEKHIGTLNQQIQDLIAMRDFLQQVASACPGSDDPHCPILQELAQPHCHAKGTR
ncbi:Cu(I)-responsive transcriptional regulator [Permianibacter sp. IMCC34836]|uniref:Cu(I)-responsive transcriptional regulator n=1 Tax=Permianibacter fluminis TaxID=2738515 RepID=UPI00155412E1|nr:Cu(I)-responsive transcriptional regulator [Permianibacter fluminis]NQD36642.1 Cu(I)-responsive transcriptional regulator [Permianibacter fluminis]